MDIERIIAGWFNRAQRIEISVIGTTGVIRGDPHLTEQAVGVRTESQEVALGSAQIDRKGTVRLS